MALAFALPDLGENIEGGEVVKLLVAPGDTVAENQPLLELETDKAVIEVPSPTDGTVRQVHVQAGDHALVGQLLVTLDAHETAEAGAVPPEALVATSSPTASAPAPAAPTPAAAARDAPAAQDRAPAQVALPDLGENIEGGEVVKLLVAPGDTVVENQPLLELETDKAVIEVPSPTSGIVHQVHVQAGDHALVGQLLLTLDTEPAMAAPAAQTLVPTGLEGAPASPAATGVPEFAAPAQTAATPPGPQVPAEFELPPPASVPPVGAPSAEAPVPASPSTRRLARELGVDIGQVPGSGPAGRIFAEDVKAHVRRLNTEAKPASSAPGIASVLPLPDLAQWGPVERQPMSKVRRLTAERLSYSWATIPQVTQFDKADITEVESWRQQYGKKAEAAGGKLTPTAIILKVAAAALRIFPQFNASVDMGRQEVVYKGYCHVGVAVDTDRGLLVPVIRDVDQKNIVQLAVELNEIAAKARTRKLTLEDMQGGCFTISNLGSIGGTGFTPIINPPEVAILGVARHSTEPVFADGQFRPRLILPLSLTYDHRLIDGADGARFLHWVVEALQNPFLVLLEG